MMTVPFKQRWLVPQHRGEEDQMTPLNIKPNLADVDDFYAELLAKHEGLSKDQSDALNARLILLLANHIGDADVLIAALDAAAQGRGIATKEG